MRDHRDGVGYIARTHRIDFAETFADTFADKAEFLVDDSIRRALEARNWPEVLKWRRIRLRMHRFALSPGPERPASRAKSAAG